MKNLWLSRIAAMLVGLILACMIVGGGVFLIIYRSAYGPSAPITPDVPMIVIEHSPIKPLKHKPQGKPIYFGGIHNLTDLYNAMHDPYVSENFEGFNYSSAHLVKLDRPVLAFVTFYIDGRGVFWASRPILLPVGETVWTDDQGNYLRAKCGNRIAYAPGLRVAPEEEVPDTQLQTPPVIPSVPAVPVTLPIHPKPPVHAFYPQPPTVGQPWGPRHGYHPISFASNPMPGWEIGFWIFVIAGLVRKALREIKN